MKKNHATESTSFARLASWVKGDSLPDSDLTNLPSRGMPNVEAEQNGQKWTPRGGDIFLSSQYFESEDETEVVDPVAPDDEQEDSPAILTSVSRLFLEMTASDYKELFDEGTLSEAARQKVIDFSEGDDRTATGE
jgi:hypothetical protein